jgi:hypothetical protein
MPAKQPTQFGVPDPVPTDLFGLPTLSSTREVILHQHRAAAFAVTRKLVENSMDF